MTESAVNGDRLFRFAVIADTHVTEAEAAAVGGYDVDTVKLGAGRSAYVVGELNRRAPDFVVHLGDITHPEPGTPAYEDSAARFHSLYRALEPPLYLVAGNHDVGEKAFVGEPLAFRQAQLTVSDQMIAEYEQHFQPQYYSFEHQDCLFVVINGMIVNSGLACEARQRDWFEVLLETNPGRRIFVFSHYPAYLRRADESEHYDATDEPGRSWLLNILRRHSVEAFYAGHVHNFFFNRYAETSCYVLPSTCFLRHDYHELFRVAPGEKQGRHDSAKLGFALVDVYSNGHLTHIIRTHGRTRDWTGPANDSEPVTPDPLPLVHALEERRTGVGVHLRQPWCESADIPTPWGLDAFSRKRIRNDYPLLALWEMGICNLRIPLDDLVDPDTRDRMAELKAIGHRFTGYSYGLPKGAARQALYEHGRMLSGWEVVAPTTNAPELFADISALKGETPVHFNAYRDRGTFSNSHGLQPDERGTIESLLTIDGARDAIDAVVFGIGWREPPVTAMAAATRGVMGLGVLPVVHVQFAHREPLGGEDLKRYDACRVAEAALGALANRGVAFYLDNFTGIDRGYYFSGGLVDRLYNPLAGARIIRHLNAILPHGCEIGEIKDDGRARVIELRNPDGALVLPTIDNDHKTFPFALTRSIGRWIDLDSGEPAEERLGGPTLVLV